MTTFPPRLRLIGIALASLLILVYGWKQVPSKQVHDSLDDSKSDDRDLSSSLLNAPVPYRDFQSLSKYPPHNQNSQPKYAFATLMCTREPDERDPFFAAAQQLLWRILWSPWRSKYPMLIFVCPSTPKYQRSILAGQGAIVKEIELVSGVIDPSKLHLSRWRDQLTKLNMWKYTEFKRIAFLDVDAFPVQNIDDIFEVVPDQNCDVMKLSLDDASTIKNSGDKELCRYTFGGSIMSDTDDELNGGFFVFSPNLLWHKKLLRDARKTDQYDEQTAEQGLLNSNLGFGLKGPFKRYTISQVYNADREYYLMKKAEGNLNHVRVVHCKMWSPLSVEWAPELTTKWDVDWMTMCRWYDSDAFVESRKTGRIPSL